MQRLRLRLMLTMSALLVLAFSFNLSIVLAAPVPFSESFETDGSGSRYTASEECTDGSGDFFTRSDGSNIGGFVDYTGQDGSSFWAGMDTNGAPCSSSSQSVTFDLDPISISTTGIHTISILAAEDDDGSNQDWDANSSVIVEYSTDGGTNYLPALCFEAVGGTNTEPAQDTNCDGTGDGVALTPTFTTFANTVSFTSGDSVILRVRYENLEAGDEDFAFDLLQLVEGLPPPEIIITEIMQNPALTSDTNGEYVELYNAGTFVVDINGWTISDDDFDSHTINNGGPLNIPAGGYIVLARNSDSGTNGGFTADYQYSGFFLSNGGDEVVLTDASANEIDRVNYDGGPNFPDPNGASMILSDITLDNNVAANWCVSTSTFGAGDSGTPGAANDDCLPDLVLISDIQGGDGEYTENFFTGQFDASPLDGQSVQIQGVVVGDFQEADESDGFFVQEETTDEDGDATSSEGIFVFCDTACQDVSVGNIVTVVGAVDEFFSQTQIDNDNGNLAVTIDDAGNNLDLVTPAIIDFPLTPALSDTERNPLEAYEGMAATTPDTMIVTEYFNYDRFSDMRVWSNGTGTGRPFQFTQLNAPNATLFAAAERDFQANSLMLDDVYDNQNEGKPYPVDFLDDTSIVNIANSFRGGDQVTDLYGIVGFSFDDFRLYIHDPSDNTAIPRPTGFGTAAVPTFTNVNPRPTSPGIVADYTVASFNVLNYFNTIDNGSDDICGSAGDLECRGADSVSERTRQLEKLTQALLEINGDVVGLVEIENSATDAALVDIVGALNAVLGAGTYDYIPTGSLVGNNGGFIGTDAITVGIIYKPARVIPVGTGIAVVDPNFTDPNVSGYDSGTDVFTNTVFQRNRPAVIQSFETTNPGEVFTVAVNHFKSKGDSGIDDACDVDITVSTDCDTGDGQGYWNNTRTDAATFLANLLTTDPTGVGDADYLILGDLNAYANEDPIVALENAGYVNMVDAFGGTYGYVFDGRWGTLDYAMASPSMAAQIVAAIEYHINADEPDALDYDDSFNPTGWYNADQYRASDHDPVIVGIDFPEVIVINPETGEPVEGGIDLDGDGVADITELPATGESPWWRDNVLLGAITALLIGLMGAGTFLRRRMS